MSNNNLIHPSAVIDHRAQLAGSVAVGPYSVIGADVVIDDMTWVGPHVVIEGPTRIGKNNKIFQFSSLGGPPQDKKYQGERTALEIGDNNVIRECCTISRGTIQDAGVTRVGNDNWIMAYVHIVHDCQVGNHTVFANGASLAGHVVIENHAVLGGFTLVHQFCRLGAHCFTAMNSVVSKDVPPFIMLSGQEGKPYGLNTEGLRRRGFSEYVIENLWQAYKIVYRSGNTLKHALELLQPLAQASHEVELLRSFLLNSTRGIVR